MAVSAQTEQLPFELANTCAHCSNDVPFPRCTCTAVTQVAVAAQTEFFITASADGHIKFWKKQPQGIEFAKHYKVRACCAFCGFPLDRCKPVYALTCKPKQRQGVVLVEHCKAVPLTLQQVRSKAHTIYGSCTFLPANSCRRTWAR